MEFLLLKQLEFNVATPTINWFAERLVRKIDGDEDLYNLTMVGVRIVGLFSFRFVIVVLFTVFCFYVLCGQLSDDCLFLSVWPVNG